MTSIQSKNKLRTFTYLTLSFVSLALASACVSNETKSKSKLDFASTLTANYADPHDLYGSLFEQVQLQAVFPDSKTFVDFEPLFPAKKIVEDYELQKPADKVELQKFVALHFTSPEKSDVSFSSPKGESIHDHIKRLWTFLRREPIANVKPDSSLIALPFAYIVPGGRFREIYYWDSYFTQLGLLADHEDAVFQEMVRNFDSLIQTFGHIPNGNRDYYISRSQPPFFSLMISLWVNKYGVTSALPFLNSLEKEYAFWMSGSEELAVQSATKRVVKLGDGSVMNRYWDDRSSARPEAYKEDVALGEKWLQDNESGSVGTVYRELRAGAESGWDYSTRWFADAKKFESIRTTSVLPVDLNSYLAHLELTLSELNKVYGNTERAKVLRAKYDSRVANIQKILWSKKTGAFCDYDWKTQQCTSETTLATVAPLFIKVATPDQAKSVAKVIRKKFLKPGGLVTSLRNSGQQWDAPNGWAPLQWMAFAGFSNYGETALASDIRKRWLALNLKVFNDTRSLKEKYNVQNLSLKSGGGEYPNQDGFGWTNGVYRALETASGTSQNSSHEDSSLKHLSWPL